MPCMNVGRAHERSLQVVIYREGDGFVAQCLNVADYQPVADAHVEHLILKSA
jgi:hypothetical protein